MDRPANWRVARWDATGILPPPGSDSAAAVYIMSARTGGMKGAFSMHSWLVIKADGISRYERYDKVGWGQPVRVNAYAPDARWYSNTPQIVASVHGEAAVRLIPSLHAAIQSYSYSDYGDYQIWPGPNSNSFIAHVLREVPQMDVVLPSLAVGRDYLSHNKIVYVASDWREIQINLWGWLGFSLGLRSGVELQILGLVAGIDIRRPAVKLPGIGRLGV